MLRGNILQLLLLKGGATKNFVTHERIENLDELHKFDARVPREIFE